MPNLSIGCAAMFDTFSGLVPCVVIALDGKANSASSSVKVTFRITRNRGAYKAGEVLESSSLWVAPKSAIRQRGYYKTIAPYSVG